MKFKTSELVNTEWRGQSWQDTPEQILAQQLEWQDHIGHLNSVANVYTKADRILVGEGVTCHVVENNEYQQQMPTGAWSDGENIYFNAKLIDEVNDYSITSLNGLNYHEVAHVLYSPRASSELVKWAKSNMYLKALNILEEGRIENLLTTKYPSTRRFLEATTLQYLLDVDRSEWADTYPIIVGRKYVDLELREIVGNMFVNNYGLPIAVEITRIVNSYRNLIFPSDYLIAQTLIERLGKIIAGNLPETKSKTCADRAQMGKGRPEGKREQTQLQDRAKKLAYQDPALSSEGQANELNQDNKLDTEYTDQQKEMLKKKLDQIVNSKDVKQDITNTRKGFTIGSHKVGLPTNKQFHYEGVSSEIRGIAKRFADELERLRVEADPAWEQQTPSGKLNIGRAMKQDINGLDRVFDRWEFNSDNSDIEAVILLDRSGSMSKMKTVCESAWAIKRAVERINGKVAIYTFNHQSRLLYGSTEKTNPTNVKTLWSSGGTNPYDGLMEAERTFSATSAPTKLLFVLTDGEWSNYEDCDNVITRLNSNGVDTCVVYLGRIEPLMPYDKWTQYRAIYGGEVNEANYNEYKSDNDIRRYKHNAKYFRAITKPTDLIQVAKDVAKDKIKVAR